MSLLFYAPRLYEGSRELIDALQAKRLLKHDGLYFLNKGVPLEFGPKDAIVCWGAHIPPMTGTPVLNASYTYPNALQVNMKGLTMLRAEGYTAFQPNALDMGRWRTSMDQLAGDWWPKRSHICVAFPEFEGYGTSYHGFKKLERALIFKGDALRGEPSPDILKMIARLGMDFVEAFFGHYNGMQYLLKVLTAPPLDTDGVKLVAARIERWVNESTTQE